MEEGDSSYRLAPIEYLARKVSLRIKEVPLTEAYGERPALSWIEWERALRNEKAPSGGDEILPATFLAAASNTSGRFYTARFGELAAVDAAAIELEQLVLDKLPDQPAMLRELRNLVRDISTLIAQYTPAPANERVASPDSENAAAADGHPSEGGQTTEVAMEGEHQAKPLTRAESRSEEGPSGSIRSRVQAYQRLVEAAEYLQRTEPHSPVPYPVSYTHLDVYKRQATAMAAFVGWGGGCLHLGGALDLGSTVDIGRESFGRNPSTQSRHHRYGTGPKDGESDRHQVRDEYNNGQ